MIENTCTLYGSAYHTIAYYSHLVPAFLIGTLAVLILMKNRSSLIITFCLFTATFILWLLGDLIAWTSPNYNLISAVWSSLDLLNILFYIFGAYFFTTLVSGKDVSLWIKVAIVLVTLPAWYITVSNISISSFYLPQCEAINNTFLTNYKILIEALVVLFIVIYGYIKSRKLEPVRRKKVALVAAGLILFFATFSVTEFIASQTGIYEINLYSLFVLPVFLGMIIYATVSMNIFQLKIIGEQAMIYVLLIMVGSQMFILENRDNRILSVITFLLSLFFAYVLLQSSRREAMAKRHIEELVFQLEEANSKLHDLDKMKTEFLSLASHQLRSPLTAIKGYASMLLEGSYGQIVPEQKVPVDRIFQSSVNLAQIVEDLLDVSKMEQGGMKFEMADVDLVGILKGLTNELQVSAKSRNLDLVFETNLTEAIVEVDSVKIRQVFANYVDNALKYTEKGTVKISIAKSDDGKKIVVGVKDSGMGIPPEIMKTLFKKFERGEGGKVNAGGSGLGLYLAKEIVNAHKGRTWAESEGRGKGSTFFVELSLK
ncbi:MAG: hypothetical protein KBC42_00685 [Candidatus Pacebacteria bacterium]|nr:hypothetical protein [Candidatus Paceibacterota bacterium]MBP9780424.1 hypothetical protein [Candidatus Paceibacterota bacterium]